ncbi:MAG: hypothetical protein EOM23_06495 [Candidatus Moranbacteria bacterium]|nr:hypothetical protein [Candidatus Moranbacteria bacterium]
METKLTLRLNDNVVERAKIYARSRRMSLSKMIESYLDSLTQPKEEGKKISITPLVESLSGVINLPADFDYKQKTNRISLPADHANSRFAPSCGLKP